MNRKNNGHHPNLLGVDFPSMKVYHFFRIFNFENIYNNKLVPKNLYLERV